MVPMSTNNNTEAPDGEAMTGPARRTVTLHTERDARHFYGRRVWMNLHGRRVCRTILPDDKMPQVGDGRTLGEYHDRVLVKANRRVELVWLGGDGLTVEVDG